MDQQKQTLEYFNNNATDWNTKASSSQFSVIDNRHNAVLAVIEGRVDEGSFLDVGCGTGQLAIEVAKRGWSSVGVDYAESMIELCKSNNRKDRGKAEFRCSSIFDFDLKSDSYDVVSAQGFIEYISLDELDAFLAKVSKCLKRDGSLAMGSRNRLFNLHSLNEFSTLELKLNTVNLLLEEAILLQTAKSQSEAMERLQALNCEYSYPDAHPEAGVKVDRRYQFSPADLMKRLSRHGLLPTRIFPVHFHGLPLSQVRDEKLSALHAELAEIVSHRYINSHAFVPFSSSYVIEAKKI
jgi:2-polyprenyl-3-methyl-5-hydroxy-6-metoxy-1,4-benzoquinol methylase